MIARLRPLLTILALVLNLGGIYLWLEYPPAGLAELRAQTLHDEARRLMKEAKYVEARHRFRVAAERYPGTVFGERAAYLEGLVAMRDIGDLAGARAAFEAYVARYPDGIFASSAKERLAFLGEVPAEPPDAGQRYLRAENLIELGRLEEALLLLLDLDRRGISGAFAARVRARAEALQQALVGAKTIR